MTHEKETYFTASDGTELFCRTWEPVSYSNSAIILLHRGHEHSGRLSDLVEELGLKDFWAFAFDLRGHGKSPGERGYAERYDVWVKDLNAFVLHVSRTHAIPMENISIVANSVGAVTACAWVHDYAPRIHSMVLAAPAFRIKLYVPFAISFLRVLLKRKPKSFIKSYVKSRMLTHDSREAQKYDDDELITRNISVGLLIGLYDTSTRILADAAAINTPTLVLSAGSDCVVESGVQKLFFERISSKQKDFITYPDFYHAVFYEMGKQKPIEAARTFILKSFGRLSKGIRIGFETGFDSGRALDHIYLNKAQGTSPLGKLIDRCYLDAIGWKGIRQRKVNMMACLTDAIEKMSEKGKTVHILDIASGPGRYLIETVRQLPDKDISVLLHDNEQKNLDAAARIADQMGVKQVQFVCGDAFDRNAVAKLSPRPDIAIVSGLYELFPDNEMVENSLAGIAEALNDGAYLIYTSQPWHPQVEMIARTLTNRVGEPWIMRRRTQAEMDELVRRAGLTKIDTRVGPYGIFTVSVARKGGSI